MTANAPHRFVGRSDRWCEVEGCNRPDRDAIHITPTLAERMPALRERAARGEAWESTTDEDVALMLAEIDRLRHRNADLEGLRDLCRELVDRWDNGVVQRPEAEIIDAMREGVAATRTAGEA